MRNVLKIEPIPPEKSLVDMVYSMIEGGHIPKTDKYRGPPAEVGHNIEHFV